MKLYELIPTIDRQRSFYGKALMLYHDGAVTLYSYNTAVCEITADGTFVRIWKGYSATTQRHINEFRQQHGMEKLSKKQWLDL